MPEYGSNFSLSLHVSRNACQILRLNIRNLNIGVFIMGGEIPKNGYGYVSNAFITCFSYCILCDSTSSCSECVDGYYLNTEKNKCLKTEGNCLEWKNATDEECHSCESGYTAKQNICYNSKCKCADGKVASYPDCNTDCSTNCRVCSASDVCTECNV